MEAQFKIRIIPLIAQHGGTIIHHARTFAAPSAAICPGRKLVCLMASLLKDEFYETGVHRGLGDGQTSVRPDGSLELTLSRNIKLKTPTHDLLAYDEDQKTIEAKHLFKLDPYLIFSAAIQFMSTSEPTDQQLTYASVHGDPVHLPSGIVQQVADLLWEISHQIANQLEGDLQGFILEVAGIPMPLKIRQQTTLMVVDETPITIQGLVLAVNQDNRSVLIGTNWESDKPRALWFRVEKKAFESMRRPLCHMQADDAVVDLVIHPLAKRSNKLAGELKSASPSVNCERDLAGMPTVLNSTNPGSTRMPALCAPNRSRRNHRKVSPRQPFESRPASGKGDTDSDDIS